jgi:hypothetical protein
MTNTQPTTPPPGVLLPPPPRKRLAFVYVRIAGRTKGGPVVRVKR